MSTPPLFPDLGRAPAPAATVHAAVEIAAPPERVFAALTDPAELAAWWGDGPLAATQASDWRIDPVPGGRWSARAVAPDGTPGLVRGELRVVDPPRVLELTWRASWDHFATTVVRYELTPVPVNGAPGTRVHVTHTAALTLRSTLDVRMQLGGWAMAA